MHRVLRSLNRFGRQTVGSPWTASGRTESDDQGGAACEPPSEVTPCATLEGLDAPRACFGYITAITTRPAQRPVPIVIDAEPLAL